MTRPINPYIAGSPLRGEKGFFGRQDTLQWVSRELQNPTTNALVLAGQRRIGKTSLLLQLERTLASDVFLPIYFDLQDKATQSLGRVLAELAGKIARRIKWQLPELDSFDDQGQFFQDSFLPNLYQVLGTDCRPVLLLDEFDVMDQLTKGDMPAEAATIALFPFLRRVMTEDPRPAFVFAVGRHAEDLSLDSDAILKVSLRRNIWVLDQESAKALVRSSETNGTLHFTDQAVEYILNLTSGHPYLTQLLCQRLWEQAYTQDTIELPEIDLPDVKTAVPDALEAGHQAFIWLWNGLDPAEKIYASALAEAAEKEGETISEDQVIQVLTTHAARLRTRDVELAPRDLIKRWVLEKAGEQKYRFAIEIIRLWVRLHKPLQEVKEEFDQFDPQAEQLYELGQQSLRHGKLDASVSYFQRALESNPRHFYARLNLGEAFLELKQIDEAITELQYAYKLDKAEARLPLARALVAQAKIKEKNGDEEGALTSCVQALEISPGENTAQKIKNAIYIKRGNADMEQGKLDTALVAYQQTGAETWEDAIPLIKSALEEKPTLFRTRFFLGEILLDLEQTNEALAESNGILIIYQKATSESKKDVVSFLEQILNQDPNDTLARLTLGSILLIEGQFDKALSELELAYKKDVGKNKSLITYILLARAEAAHITGDWLVAFSDCVLALEIDPTQLQALEIMKETVNSLRDAGIAASNNNLVYAQEMPTKDISTLDKNQLRVLTYKAQKCIRLLGVVAYDPDDWKKIAQNWYKKIRNYPNFQVSILCESDNTLFSKSLTYEHDIAENRLSFQELQFIRDRALIDFPDMLMKEGISPLENKQVAIEITHLPVPISIVQIDERIFANLWLHDIGDRFEEIVPTHPWRSRIEKYIATYFDPMGGRKYASRPGEEVLEVFDHERMPRGIYPRNSFYNTDYSQQVIWAFVFDQRGRLLIHRRADNAKDNQGMWDKSVGGHVEFSDTDTSHSAYREVIEELFIAEAEKIQSPKTQASLKKLTISDEEIIYLGEWRPEKRKRYPFDEIRSFTSEWAFFRYRESERLYSPRTLPDGTIRRLRVIPDIFFFVADSQFKDKTLEELQNSTFKLIEIPDLKNVMNGALSGKVIPGFDKVRMGEGNPIPKFSPDLVNIMTGKLYDVLVEFSQYIKRYIQQQ